MKKFATTIFTIVLFSTFLFSQTNSVPYSKAVESNGFLFVAGHLGTKDGKLVTESFEAEMHQSMLNIQQVLAENKLTFDDVVTVTVYLKDMNNFDKMNDVYRTYFKFRYPARTCVGVAALPRNGNVEITVTAELKKDKD